MEVSGTDYRTPTRAVQVEIALDGGRYDTVEMFLGTVSQFHSGPETIDEALNRARDFLPVRSSESEKTFLVRRHAIRILTVSDAIAAENRAPESNSCVDLVRLELASGETIEGTLATILPPNRPRLSDYFNDGSPDFVPLAVDVGVSFVNRDFISVVWL